MNALLSFVYSLVLSDCVSACEGVGLDPQFGTRGAKFVKNRAFDNGYYGVAAFASTGTQFISNVTSGSGDAEIYVGDSPKAYVTIAGNKIEERRVRAHRLRGRVVVVSSPPEVTEETPPTANTIFGNVILDNRLDLFWDESGSHNRFVGNDCEKRSPRKSIYGMVYRGPRDL